MTRFALVLGLVASLGCGAGGSTDAEMAGVQAGAGLSVRGAMESAASLAGFERAVEPREFVFPRDHGPHDGYRTEWWYFTGNLEAEDGRRFGYQLTFFRQLLTPETRERTSAWATEAVFMGHFAVTDVQEGSFYPFQRFQREALGLSGATFEPVRVWLDSWSLELTDDNPPTFEIQAADGDVALALGLTARKPITLQGDRGLSQKGSGEGNASYYYSITDLESAGTLRMGDSTFEVSGRSWLDREWSTSALDESQVGWDWFALQLDDGREIMFYQLRRTDGSRDPHSEGVLVRKDGSGQRLDADSFELEVTQTWDSPRGGTYPSRWRVAIPQADLEFEVTPLVADQELDAVVRYWEGAVEVRGFTNDRPVTGRGYVELTGYADPEARIPPQ